MTDRVKLSDFGTKLRENYEANLIGKDYAVGDIHGCLELLKKGLEAVGFDETKDRLFPVGDLVDRGEDSLGVLEFLCGKPWCHPVPGNHELMFVDFMDNNRIGYGFYFQRNGGVWIKDVLEEHKEFLKEAALWLSTLPRFITLKKPDGTQVHIIHAELKTNRPLEDSDLAEDAFLEEMMTYQATDGDSSFWGRWVFNNMYGQDLSTLLWYDQDVQRYNRLNSPNLSTIISGHSVMEQPTRFGKLLNIDTGAFYLGGKLTFHNITDDLTFQVSRESDSITYVEPIDVAQFFIMKG